MLRQVKPECERCGAPARKLVAAEGITVRDARADPPRPFAVCPPCAKALLPRRALEARPTVPAEAPGPVDFPDDIFGEDA